MGRRSASSIPAGFVLLLLIMTLLVGCGKESSPASSLEASGKETSTAPDQPEEQEAKVEPGTVLTIEDDGRPVLVAFGDSLTAGFGVDRVYSYPAYLQKLLDSRGYRYRVVNAGISGDTTAGGVTRLPNVASMKPSIVIVELGGNDGLRGLTLKQTRENLEKIVVALQQAGAKVVLAGITLPRNYGPDYIQGFEQVYKDLAAKHDLPFLPFLLEGVALNAKAEGLMQDDGIHARPAGNLIVAENVFEALKPVLGKPSAKAE